LYTRYKGHTVYKQLEIIVAIWDTQATYSGHTYGTITEKMGIIRTQQKGKHLNTLEKYHIYNQ
jgi:hypothetical protein